MTYFSKEEAPFVKTVFHFISQNKLPRFLLLTTTPFCFCSECIAKFGPRYGSNVWEAVNKCFDALPIAAVIDKKVFSSFHFNHICLI